MDLFDESLFGAAVMDALADKGVLVAFFLLATILILCSKRLRFEYKGRERTWSLEASKGNDGPPKPKPRRGKPSEVITDVPPSRKM
jgi:hypothetical protein